jgi:peptidyl-prolyl cis-trans isomerase A (cyclophilin A)
MDTPAPPVAPGEGQLLARFHTTAGVIDAYLYEHQAPRTVANFVALATGAIEWTCPDGHPTSRPLYDGTTFHRVVPDYMIQGGCPEGTGRGSPGYLFDDELDPTLDHSVPGVLAMANAGPHTNGSQFYITEVATPWLDGRHTVFGRVVRGLRLVSRISRMGNRAVTIERVEILRRDA